MAELAIRFDGSFGDWQRAARRALAAGVAPERLRWVDVSAGQEELALGPGAETGATPNPPPDGAATHRVPRAFLDLARDVACHRDARRWPLLYRALWRLTHGEPRLLADPLDAEVAALAALAKEVHRDIHKMRAFVRFREVATEAGPWFVAWFEPRHLVVEANAPFFRDRFANMRWSILTPDRCAHWDPGAARPELVFTPGARREEAPAEDAAEELWRTYYASIFNPARVKIGAMRAEIPRHYWRNLPEAALIPRLLAESRPRVEAMVEKSAKKAAGRAGPADETGTG